MALGDTIKRLRLEKGMSATELAEKVKISKQLLAKLEANKQLTTSNENYKNICIALDTSMDRLDKDIKKDEKVLKKFKKLFGSDNKELNNLSVGAKKVILDKFNKESDI